MTRLTILVLSGFLALASAIPADAAESVTLVLNTEENPPLNYLDPATEQVVGIATEIVRKLMARANVTYRIDLLPWQRAFAGAREEPNTCVYSTTFNDERKPLFKWVMPLTTNSWALFAAPGSSIKINSLEDARRYKIGGYQGDAKAQFLLAQGFDVAVAPQDVLNAMMLIAGRIDIWATTERAGPELARRSGAGPIEKLFVFREVVMGLACSLQTPDALIDQLNETLRQIKAAS